MKDLMGMMKQVGQMQARVQQMQEELASLEINGQSGGGLVKVTLTGKGDLKKVSIDPSLIKADEAEILEDLIVAAAADVSRLHARIRYDAPTGRFLLSDLSAFGTTLNQRHIPRGYDERDGVRTENGTETPLPDRARIGLADMVYLDFEIVR